MRVCERTALFGGARGPPGTVGLFRLIIGREILEVDVGVFVSIRPDENEPFDECAGVADLSRFDILALRPSEAKNPVLLVELDEPRERIEDGGVPLPALDDDRVGYVRGWFMAKEGYGSVGMTLGGVISRQELNDRSVAVDASGRRGNVASDIIDERDVWRG